MMTAFFVPGRKNGEEPPHKIYYLKVSRVRRFVKA